MCALPDCVNSHIDSVSTTVTNQLSQATSTALEKDLVHLQKQQQVFEVRQYREHQGFKKHKLLLSVNWKQLKTGLKEKALDCDIITFDTSNKSM